MPRDSSFAIDGVALPTGELVRVATLCRSRHDDDCGTLGHLRRSRRGDESMREAYDAGLPETVRTLVDGVGGSYDVIVSPPSDHYFAVPYREAFLARHEAADLSPYVHRAADAAQAGAAGTTLLDVIAGLRCDPLPIGPTAAAVLIVDDIFEGGKTVAALLHVMRGAGLRTRAVTVACPLRVL